MAALDATETEFQCAGLCELSKFYTFSEVGLGPPYQNCTQAINDYVSSKFPLWAAFFFIFAITLACGIVASFMICCCYKKDEPMFGRKNNV
mmetsp:Transcript_48674/g.35832  ORF Transcript_48674/g.35832 Transcript_48674/m.35832 type:complete len:91 (+) Transcript_48674:580-852(+)